MQCQIRNLSCQTAIMKNRAISKLRSEMKQNVFGKTHATNKPQNLRADVSSSAREKENNKKRKETSKRRRNISNLAF